MLLFVENNYLVNYNMIREGKSSNRGKYSMKYNTSSNFTGIQDEIKVH